MSERNPRNPNEGEGEGENEMAMKERLFSSNPISYKMDRKSPEAFDLRLAVTNKLFDFLGNYSDEVLAEYVVVLVCNGKNQNQARYDLEEFLGQDSGKFVVWLWDHLAKEHYVSRASIDASCLKAEVATVDEDVSNKESDIPLPKDERYELSHWYTKAVEEPESLQRWCPSMDASFSEANTERLQGHLDKGNTEVVKHFPTTVGCSPEILSGGEQCLHNEFQHQKIAKIDLSAMHGRPFPITRTEQVARALRSVITEDHQSRPLSIENSAKIRLQPAAIDNAHQIAEPRGNVWDRLGKPCNEDDIVMRGKNNQHGRNLIKREIMDFRGEELRNPRSMSVKQDARLVSNVVGELVVLDDSRGRIASTNHSDLCIKLEHSSNTTADLHHVNNTKRKRLYGESNFGNSSGPFSGCKDNHHQAKEAPPKWQDSFPIKYNRLESSNEVTSEAKGYTMSISESVRHSVIFARVEPNSHANKVSSRHLNKSAPATTPTKNLVPVSSQMPSKSESPGNSANHKPVKDEVLDVKSRLRQIEMDMLKLRSKQAEIRNDAKPNVLTGVQNHSEEDIESRTVLVTNVHFAATREALLSHFTKCGVVAKVIMLTDTITAQPKGAAYVVFANKDSVDKAISMSGISFFSRILTVMRKADMPPDFLVPSQSTGKLLQPLYSPPYWKGSVQKPYTSSHLLWRRENPASRENSISASANGLESSTTGE